MQLKTFIFLAAIILLPAIVTPLPVEMDNHGVSLNAEGIVRQWLGAAGECRSELGWCAKQW